MSSAAAAAAAALPPFHIAIPVHNLDAARTFYGGTLGCPEGRSSKTWIDWNLYGHQLVTHWASNEVRRESWRGVAAAAQAAVYTALLSVGGAPGPDALSEGLLSRRWRVVCKHP